MSTKGLLIIGAGGMAREVAWTVRCINARCRQYRVLGFVVTDLSRLGAYSNRVDVLGDYEWIRTHESEVEAVAVGVGNPQIRSTIAAEVRAVARNAAWPALVHPTAVLDHDSVFLAEGSFVGAGVIGTVNLRIGPFALCNFGCTLGHEADIGESCVINPGANVSGGVTVGARALVGTGARILQYLSVGADATVGAGAVVTKNVPSGVTVLGIPARPFSKANHTGTVFGGRSNTYLDTKNT